MATPVEAKVSASASANANLNANVDLNVEGTTRELINGAEKAAQGVKGVVKDVSKLPVIDHQLDDEKRGGMATDHSCWVRVKDPHKKIKSITYHAPRDGQWESQPQGAGTIHLIDGFGRGAEGSITINLAETSIHCLFGCPVVALYNYMETDRYSGKELSFDFNETGHPLRVDIYIH